MRKYIPTIVALLFLSGCTVTLPPRPSSCDYEEMEVSITEVPVDYVGNYYCMDALNATYLAGNYMRLRQCVTDLEIWAIQVEHGRE